MDRRVLVFFCLLTAVRSGISAGDLEIKVEKGQLTCANGVFDEEPAPLKEDVFYTYTCTSNKENCHETETCAKQRITVKILSSENLIQLDMGSLVSVILSDILVTILIGWAVYTICAQPPTRSSYQGNKASDRQALINNQTPSGGDTYQRLNTRSDEYSALHAPRKNKNKQSV